MHRILASGFLLSLSFCCSSLMAQSSGISLNLAGYPNVQSANQVIEKWTPEQHLYVKGDLGISAENLDQLERWLDENGPHWTVVLLRNASGENYQSLDRRSYQGMDAVEYALGRGLALRTSFSELVDPRTSETDGAVFVLFLDERKFSYYASVAQDVRSLGEAHWVGELDREAFRAMRGGGRILDAVRGTVLSINSRLSKKINAEMEQAEREKRARQRAFVNLKTDIASLRESVLGAKGRGELWASKFPEATGELTTPPIEDWRRRIDELEGFLTEETTSKSRERYNEVSHEVEGFLNAYAEYETFDGNVHPIEIGIQELNSSELAVGRPMAAEAQKHLEVARETRTKGERGLSDLLSKARNAVASGHEAIAAEQDRLKRVESRKNLIWKTILVTAGIVTAAFLGILVWLNRRRAPAMKRAQEALAEREKLVNAEMEKVYELFDRSGEILGDKKKVEKRGYEGTTKKLTGNTFEDVDDLFVMSSEVERVMDEAREMIKPKKVAGKIANMVSASRFEQGVNRISGEPLKFHRDKGLPLVIQRESERTGEEPPEEVTMTFDKVFEAFHDRTATAEHTLNTIENSLLQVDDNLNALQEQIETGSTLDRELSDAADDDGFFELPALFEKLIPSAQADFDEADEIAAVDPVEAIQNQIPRGSRKMVDALTLVDSIKQARTEIFPKLNELAPQLQELEYNTNWIQQRVRSLSENANGLLETAVDRSVRPEAVKFGEELTGFGKRVERSVDLAREVKHNAEPSMADLTDRITTARKEIADKLSLSPESCLKEYESNPDLNLQDARKQFAAAQAALHHGGVEAAEKAQSTLLREIETGKQLIDQSIRILHEFDQTHLARGQQHDAVRDKLPRHEDLLTQLNRDYVKSALTLQAADPTYEDPSATVETHLVETRDALQDGMDLIEQATEKYKQGHLLESDNMLQMADQHFRRADALLAEVDTHCSRLSEVSKQNEGKLATMQREVESLAGNVKDRRTMQPTLSLYQSVLGEIDGAQNEIRNTTPRDPFQDGRAIDGFTENVRNLAAKIEADHDAHAEASRALQGAKQERGVAEKLVNQAKHDGIPDSPATKTGIRDVQMYDNELAQVERELNGDHNDWKKVDQAAARIHAELGIKAGQLRGELQRAQKLMAVFQSASSSVFEATRWTGGFGTRIFGSPGSKELERARGALNSGDYSAMAELARAAQIAAQHAIQRAQREVYRRQREEARRAEAARRRRRRSSINIGGGSGGISFPSNSGRRSSSSSRRSSSSSSRSSGSGFSRSGW